MSPSILKSRYIHDLHREVTCRRSHESQDISVSSLSGNNTSYVFNRRKLYAYRGRVAAMLSQLPDTLHQSSPACTPQRWFLARYDYDGRPWTADLSTVDLLLAMGRALGMVIATIPQAGQDVCDAPYIYVADTDARRSEKFVALPERDHRLAAWNYRHLRKPRTDNVHNRQSF